MLSNVKMSYNLTMSNSTWCDTIYRLWVYLLGCTDNFTLSDDVVYILKAMEDPAEKADYALDAFNRGLRGESGYDCDIYDAMYSDEVQRLENLYHDLFGTVMFSCSVKK